LPAGDAETVQKLLPPRYLVPPEVDAAVAASRGVNVGGESASPARPDTGLIDADLLRIRTGNQAVPVRPISREQKDRRKRRRVLIVFVVSAAILLGVLIWLMRSSPA
jgi:hypothetical protein